MHQRYILFLLISTLPVLILVQDRANCSAGTEQVSYGPDAKKPGICPATDTDIPGWDMAVLAAADSFQHGPYDIVSCDKHEGRIITGVLDKVRQYANHTFEDAQRGMRSQYGFVHLFKTEKYQSEVMKLFQKIMDGASPYPPSSNGPTEYRPTILCVSKDNPEIPENLYTACMETTNFVSTDNGNVVVVCPGWWTRSDRPPARCPIVTRSNHVYPSWDYLANHKVGILIHELVHVYIGLFHPAEFTEAYGLQECIDLSPEDSIKNAQSYAMYATGK